jgi:hypothetical protein
MLRIALRWPFLFAAGGLLALALSPSFSETKARQSDGTPAYCSVINLIATPERFHGRRVRVAGYYRYGFERSALYPSKEIGDNLRIFNGIWIDIGDDSSWSSFNERYIVLDGIFDTERKGHLGAFVGSIREVNRDDVIDINATNTSPTGVGARDESDSAENP